MSINKTGKKRQYLLCVEKTAKDNYDTFEGLWYFEKKQMKRLENTVRRRRGDEH